MTREAEASHLYISLNGTVHVLRLFDVLHQGLCSWWTHQIELRVQPPCLAASNRVASMSCVCSAVAHMHNHLHTLRAFPCRFRIMSRRILSAVHIFSGLSTQGAEFNYLQSGAACSFTPRACHSHDSFLRSVDIIYRQTTAAWLYLHWLVVFRFFRVKRG